MLGIIMVAVCCPQIYALYWQYISPFMDRHVVVEGLLMAWTLLVLGLAKQGTPSLEENCFGPQCLWGGATAQRLGAAMAPASKQRAASLAGMDLSLVGKPYHRHHVLPRPW